MWFFIGSAIVSFFVFSPYSFLEPKYYYNDIVRFRGTLMFDTGEMRTPLWYYIFYHLKEGLGFFIWLLVILGLGLLKAKDKREVNMLVLSFPLAFLLTANIWSTIHSQRYILPAALYLAIFAGLVLYKILKKLNRRLPKFGGVVTFTLVGIVCWQPLLRSLKFDKVVVSSHTGRIAKQWIEESIAQETVVLTDGVLFPNSVSIPGADLYPTREVITEMPFYVAGEGRVGSGLRAYEQAIEGKKRYKIIASPSIAYSFDDRLEAVEQYSNVDSYLEKGVEVIVTDSWSINQYRNVYPWSEDFSSSLNDKYKVVAEFVSTVDFGYDPHAVRMDYQALDEVDVFEAEQVFGPRILVYKRI